MTPQEREKVMALLALISEQSPQPASRSRLIFTVDQVSKYPAPKIITALQKIAIEARRFPTVAEILAAIGIKNQTDRELAVQSAALISGAIRKFGSWGTNAEVKAYVGPVAWKVVECSGGWQGVCDVTTNENESYLMSQWKEHAASLLGGDSALSEATRTFLSSETKKSHLRLVASSVDIVLNDGELDV